jgi:polyisoprenoid-binding protein YceI
MATQLVEQGDLTGLVARARWRLDSGRSSAEFQVEHFWGLITVHRHFERLDGVLEIDGAAQPRGPS